ncbi:hypothetical protein TYRP_008555 [Tyrophagus putrescentiae]|nr:hypothetical protein TYRP_008555 [Tyrophagus putrescentiae]
MPCGRSSQQQIIVIVVLSTSRSSTSTFPSSTSTFPSRPSSPKPKQTDFPLNKRNSAPTPNCAGVAQAHHI